MNVKWDKRFLGLAKHISSWSKDPSTKVGAVITDQNHRIVSLGYNGFARGVDDRVERYDDRSVKYELIVHGEMNAMNFATRDLTCCTVYTWPFMPCARCASNIIQRGITRVVSIENHNERWVESFKLTMDVLKEANVSLTLYPEITILS